MPRIVCCAAVARIPGLFCLGSVAKMPRWGNGSKAVDVEQGKSAQAGLRNDRHLACSECVHNKINPAWPPQETRLLFTRRSSKHGCLITHKQALGFIGLMRQNKEFLVLLRFFFRRKKCIHSKDHFRYILNWVKSERAPLYNVTKQPSMLTEQLHTQLFL